jgi:protein-tyrosine-phosphatase
MRIVIVCTGNTCRSPIAEALARRAFADHDLSDIAVTSAGTGAWDGAPVSEGAYLVGLERQVDLSQHQATLLTRDVVNEADLILTMARHHRARVEELGGGEKAHLLGRPRG